MNTATLMAAASRPRVDLLPPEIGERRKLVRLQAGLVGVVVLAAAGVGFAYVSGQSRVTNAKSQLSAAQDQQTSLQRKLSSLSYVTQAGQAVDAAEAALTRAAATEIHWSDYMADLSIFIPKSVWVTQLTMTESLQAGSITNPQQNPATVGTVSVAGSAVASGTSSVPHTGVADWLDAVMKEKGFVSPWVSSATERYIGTKRVSDFSSTAAVSSHALSERCVKPGVC